MKKSDEEKLKENVWKAMHACDSVSLIDTCENCPVINAVIDIYTEMMKKKMPPLNII